MKRIMLLLLLALPISLLSQDYNRTSTKLMIYNSNFAVVDETIQTNLIDGLQAFSILDVPSLLIPESVMLKFNGSIREQAYHYDMFDMGELLYKFLGKNITLNSLPNEVLSGKLLSINNNQIILQDQQGKVIIIPKFEDYTLFLDNLPEGFTSKPTLKWLVVPKKSGKQDMALTYQTEGLSWKTSYILTISDDEKQADLQGWFDVTNTSGAPFANAELSLYAGDANRVAPDRAMYKRAVMAPENDVDYGGFSSSIELNSIDESSVMDNYMFKLPQNISINNNEKKQFPFFEANKVKIRKKYIATAQGYFQSEQKIPTYTLLLFDNNKDNNLGRILPNGTIRVYKSAKDQNIFVGENYLKNLSLNEEASVNIGTAYNLNVKQKSIENKVFNEHQSESTIQFTADNSNGTEDKELEINKFYPRKLSVIKCSHKYELIGETGVKLFVNAKAGKIETIELKVKQSD